MLAVVGLIVLGPDKLPGLARDAARMIRTLRELANGARTQLRDELGPEFAHLADMDLRNLSPRTAITRAVLGETDLGGMNPADMLRDVFAEPAEPTAAPSAPSTSAATTAPQPEPAAQTATPDGTPYDTDAT